MSLASLRRRRLTVTANERIGAYVLLRVSDPDGPAPGAGQFTMLAAAERWGGGEDERPYLARAFSVARFSGGEAQYLLEDVGPASRRLCELRAGEQVWALGPLGRGFTPPADDRRALLVGGGIGVAPLLILQDALRDGVTSIDARRHSDADRARGHDAGGGDADRAGGGEADRAGGHEAGGGDADRAGGGDADDAGGGEAGRPGDGSGRRAARDAHGPPAGAAERYATVLLGFRDRERAESAALFDDPRVAVDDGSVGHRGFVTELLQAELRRDARAAVYACGPAAMLEGVRAICERERVPAQLALEAGMACGFGACYGCAVPRRGGGYLRVCVDGPVIDAAELEHVEEHAGALE